MKTNKYNIDQEVYCHGEKYFILKFREVFGTYQYSLGKEKGGEFHFACGEFSIDGAVNEEENNHDKESVQPDMSFLAGRPKEQEFDSAAALMNTTSAIMRQPIDGAESGIDPEIAKICGSSLFFKPSRKMVKWLVKYSNGRTIIDVGAGQGHLVRMIKQLGGKAFGLEPNFDHERYIEHGRSRWGNDFDINEMLPWSVEKAQGLIFGMADRAMLVFARPCHSDFVFNGIRNMPDEMEALYITVPKNLERYSDLGLYQSKAVKLEHEGESEDNEIVMSIKKQ